MAIEVWGSVAPPDRPALTDGDLGGIDASACGFQLAVSALGFFDSPPSIHQFGNKLMTAVYWQVRIGGSPNSDNPVSQDRRPYPS
ncbi:hypothetical protein [Bosea sp. TAF32]|uniref:hypothetical protein n=1 Tax=Bosea sp. TAF32 TaxID=3237482 RepID=UPI003F917EFF